VRISVRGEGHAESPAERATASLAVGFDGENRRDVRDRSTAALAVCIDSVTSLHDPAAGPVVDWAADDVQVWADARMFAMAQSAPVDLAPAPVHVDVVIDVRFAARSAEARTDG
jgi:hypothetical protein